MNDHVSIYPSIFAFPIVISRLNYNLDWDGTRHRINIIWTHQLCCLDILYTFLIGLFVPSNAALTISTPPTPLLSTFPLFVSCIRSNYWNSLGLHLVAFVSYAIAQGSILHILCSPFPSLTLPFSSVIIELSIHKIAIACRPCLLYNNRYLQRIYWIKMKRRVESSFNENSILRSRKISF